MVELANDYLLLWGHIKEVKNIGGSRNVASFKSTDKTFQFPGAFEQGFLLLDE